MKYGISLSDIQKNPDSVTTLVALKQYINIQNLCDIGAHDGEWSRIACIINPSIKSIALFEPQKEFFKILINQKYQGANIKYFNIGIGNTNRILKLYGGTASASLFIPSEFQKKLFPKSLKNVEEKVKITTLDQIYSLHKLPFPDVIKIDVQGYELYVLKGAKKVISRARYIIIEVSFKEFYKEQPKLSKLLLELEQNNYSIISKGYEWWSSKKPSILLQIDIICKNNNYN